MYTVKEILSKIGIHPYKVKNVYLFGSQVYGTADEKSDYDYYIIANHSVDHEEFQVDDINAHIMTPDHFQKDLNWHKIQNLECIYGPEEARLQETINFDDFEITPIKLKHAIAQGSFFNWEKGKKKILNDDVRRGQKCLFHGLRIPLFGAQIAEFGKIVDFSAGNEYWDFIKDEENWVKVKKEYKGIYKENMKQFKALMLEKYNV